MFKKLSIIMLSALILTSCSQIKLKTSINYDLQNPVATIKLYNEDEIVIELYPDMAPNTVNNFISLAEEGFYDDLKFHRTVENYIMQTGDPLMNNYGTPGYEIKGEFKQNGFKNKLKHKKGCVSMARGKDLDSAGSQFFITLDDANYLNGSYAAFGKVTCGMDKLEDLSHINQEELITNELYAIESIIVDLNSYKYIEPTIVPIYTDN